MSKSQNIDLFISVAVMIATLIIALKSGIPIIWALLAAQGATTFSVIIRTGFRNAMINLKHRKILGDDL